MKHGGGGCGGCGDGGGDLDAFLAAQLTDKGQGRQNLPQKERTGLEMWFSHSCS